MVQTPGLAAKAYSSSRRVLIGVLDCLLLVLAYYFSFYLRLDQFTLGSQLGAFFKTLPIAIVAGFLGMHLAGVYRGIWRYASLNDLANVVQGTLYGIIGLIVGVVFLHGLGGYPRSVFLINAGFVILAIGGARFTRRMQFELVHRGERVRWSGKPVLIIGGGYAADDLIREIRQNADVKYHPVGIVDDSPDKQGREILGVKVLGPIDELPLIARETNVEELLIAVPSATGDEMKRIVKLCRETKVPFRTMPGAGDILDGRVRVGQLRQVNMQDLLRRPAVRLDRVAIGGYLTGKRVLVTGAAGSIGSELCRQIARFEPAEIILVDHAENGLFYMNEEFERSLPGTAHSQMVADVTDACLMKGLFQLCKPHVVFHAAAHKHVTLMEENHQTAFRNNVRGTRTVAEAASIYNVEKFIMISTDKAVNPTNIMGLSKRIAELVVQSMNDLPGQRTAFSSVRFGNVMGSEGSVIPLWHRQIKGGGPVTVTHPEVTRYFMTIPEAVQLVLQAAAMGEGGEVFVLEMGEALKVLDVARQVIELCGFEPGKDIEIKIIGLRPGEKLYEELITGGEGIVPTEHEKIMVLRDEKGHSEDLRERILQFEESIEGCDSPREIMEIARELVPEYEAAVHSM